MHGRDSSLPCACRPALFDSLLADRPRAHPFTITERDGRNGGAATVLTRCYFSSTRPCFMLTQKLELGDLSKQVTHVSTAGVVITVSFERTAEGALSLALTCADSSPRPAVMFHGSVMDAAQGCELELFLQEPAATWCMGGKPPATALQQPNQRPRDSKERPDATATRRRRLAVDNFTGRTVAGGYNNGDLRYCVRRGEARTDC